MSIFEFIGVLATLGLAAFGLRFWWVAPANLANYVIDDELDLDEIEALVHRRNRGTRGNGRRINKLPAIYECSLVGDAEALLVGVGRGAQVGRDCFVRLQALVKLEGCSINGVYHSKDDFSPSKKLVSPRGEPELWEHSGAVVSSQRLNQAIRWSIQQAINGDAVVESRLVQAGNWVNLWMTHSDSTTIKGSWDRLRLRAEWKIRTSLGLELPLPSQ